MTWCGRCRWATASDAQVTLPAYIAGVAALLTVAGHRGTRRTLSVSWNLLWAALAVAVISGIVTLPAALVTVLVGRLAGLGIPLRAGLHDGPRVRRRARRGHQARGLHAQAAGEGRPRDRQATGRA